jgi:hypothetical protein
MWIGDGHDYRKCMEVYEFFVSSEKNYVTVSDIAIKKDLKEDKRLILMLRRLVK